MQHHGESLRTLCDEDEFESFLSQFLDSSFLNPKELAGLLFAKKLTLHASQMQDEDHQHLKKSGYNDEEILHLVQIISYFNFVNRMAEGLGVQLEGDNHFDVS